MSQENVKARGGDLPRRAVLLLAALLVLALALAPRAEAFVYWTNSPPCPELPCTGPPAIGRANLDGTGVNQRFIEVEFPPVGIAVDPEHIYWMTPATGAIGRANLDGTGVEPSFITTGIPPVPPPRIAVDAAHLYWSNANGIGRANLDATGVDPNFITTAHYPGDLAVDAQHIYWAPPPPHSLAIGRANLDGSGVDESFITTGHPTPTGGIAVDADHLYWAAGRMVRANLDGTEIDQGFITSSGAVGDIAVDAAHVYWTWGIAGLHGSFTAGIGRANLDGTGIDLDFIDPSFGTREGFSTGVAVDALTDTKLAGKAIAAKTQRQHGNAIVVEVKVKADERLIARASGKIEVNPSYRLKPKKDELTAGEAHTLKLKPKKKSEARQIAAALNRDSATAKLKVKLTDLAANSEVEKLRVKLKR
jgi:virginiamycin B lyase